jgi:RNA polymerase sigma-70 factor, ECF subfamily
MQTTDAELMARVREGDDDAFATIVDRYKHQLVRYLANLTGNRAAAEEYAQETFVRLYLTASRYREEGKLAPLLYRIATNLIRSDAVKTRRWSDLLALFGRSTAPPLSPQDAALRTEVTMRVSSAIESLPLSYRAAILLREIEGWSYEEIAEALDCNSGTVKSRISRGREMLKKLLAPYWLGERSERRSAQ